MINVERSVRSVGIPSGELIDFPTSNLRFRPSAYVIVVNDRGQILLIRDTNSDQLSLPGGGIDLGERALDAVRRELNEEAGITVPTPVFWNFFENFVHFDNSEKPAWHAHMLIFTAKLRDDQPLVGHDLDEGTPEWIDIQTIDFTKLANIFADIVREYLSTQYIGSVRG